MSALAMVTDETCDRELVRRCTQGDAGAWDAFVRRYVRLVIYVVRETLIRFGGRFCEEDVDDVTAEIYAHLVDDRFRVLRNLREPFNMRAWLAVVARRKARDFSERRSLRALSLDRPASNRPDGSSFEELLGVPEDLSYEDREEIRLSIDEAGLNSRERLLVTLYFLRDRGYREISEITGIPENSLGPTLGRALGKLRTVLQKRGWVG